MDRANSAKLYPDELEMLGSQIRIRPEAELSTYKTKISRSQHVQGDPQLDCSVYTLENSYNDCIQNEIHKLFANSPIGCQPPLYTQDLNRMCNQKFNFSSSKDSEIVKLLLQLTFQDWKSECSIPCTRSKYTTRYLSKSPYNRTGLNILFDRTVDVTKSTFSINEQSLLTRLGGSISMGRTVLWILVTLLGAAQVTNDLNSLFPQVINKVKSMELMSSLKATRQNNKNSDPSQP